MFQTLLPAIAFSGLLLLGSLPTPVASAVPATKAPSKPRGEPVPTPPAPPTIDGGVLRFNWAGKPGRNFTLQLAADPRFEYIVEVRHTDRPAADVPRPLPGSYFARLRDAEPDGSVGPFSDAIKIEIPANAPATACLVAGERGVCAVYAPATSPPSR